MALKISGHVLFATTVLSWTQNDADTVEHSLKARTRFSGILLKDGRR
jgi:hypothetical protein